MYTRFRYALLARTIHAYNGGTTDIDMKSVIEEARLIGGPVAQASKTEGQTPNPDRQVVTEPARHNNGRAFRGKLVKRPVDQSLKHDEGVREPIPAIENLQAWNEFTEQYSNYTKRPANELVIVSDDVIKINKGEMLLGAHDVRVLRMLLTSYGAPPFGFDQARNHGFIFGPNPTMDTYTRDQLHKTLIKFHTWGLISYKPDDPAGILVWPVKIRDDRR
jgi:hypothetical protein